MGFIVTASQRGCEQMFALLYVAPQLTLGSGTATEPARVVAGKAKTVATNPVLPNSVKSGTFAPYAYRSGIQRVNRRIK
jgi:hypothetical protein